MESGEEMEFRMSNCVHGYHVYQRVWDAVVGENLECERETSNEKDRYAVVAKKAELLIGHLPKKISRICSLFLLMGGIVVATVTGRQLNQLIDTYTRCCKRQ